MAHQPASLAMPGPFHQQQPPKQPIPARIVVSKDGGAETLSNGELLYTHQFVRQRANASAFALHDACEIGDLFFVKAFFQPTPDGRPNPLMSDPGIVNKRDFYAQTPLHLAILHGRYEIARILLKNGAEATMSLEGSPQLHVLLTLIGSFPQYQIPMLQPTPTLLQQTVKYLQQQIQSDSTTTTSTSSQPILPTPTDLILNPKFAQFQSYGIRMLTLLLQSLQFIPRHVYSRDDNGRTIFHICAQYDLIEPFLVLIDRLFTNPILQNGMKFDSPNITQDDIDLLNHRKRTFCTSLFAQDNLHRNIFHYCAQYRSYHFLQRVFEFITNNVTLFPPLGMKSIQQAEVITDLTTVYDVYHRTPLHYAYFYAAPFYSRISSLSKLLGTYRGVNTYEVTHASSSTTSTTTNNTTTSMGDDNNTTSSKYGFGIDYDHNYTQLESDPIIQAFLTMNDKIQSLATQGVEGYTNLIHIIGQTTGLDLYQRTPYQTAVFNQPIIGTNNAGTMPAMNINDFQQSDDNNNTNTKIAKTSYGKMKPTLIGWSPRCFEHHTAPRITRRDEQPPPENVRRLQVLLNFTDGVLRSNEFNHRVTQTDILALNHLYYATLISELSKTLSIPNQQQNNDIVIQSLPIGQFTQIDTAACTSTTLRLGDIDAIVPSTETEQQLLHKELQQIFTSAPIIPQNTLHWNHRAPRATFSDVLRCHEYSYITRLMSMTENVEEQCDWSATTTESIDVLHRDLHISVPTIPSLPLHKLKSTYQTTMDYYFHVLQSAQEYSLLPPHAITNTNAFNNPSGTLDLIKKRNQIMAPFSHLAQTILYRERSLLNLNLGFANLQIPQLISSNGINEYDLAEKLFPNDLIDTQQTIQTRSELLGDAHELYDSALFPIQVYRELSKNMQTGVSNWRMQLTPSIYTNSIIQSGSLVNILYHYPNHEALGIHIDKHTGLTVTDPNISLHDDDYFGGLKGTENIRLRERTSTYTGELSSTTPAPFITRHQPQPIPLKNLDEDTSLSAFSWFAALFAGGTVIDAVKRVVHGQYKNAFCAVRPPGHHSGPMGLVATDENIGDSHGFCLLNNVAMGAAYAKTLYPDIIKRVAIVDFDVHHGNGTEAIVRTLQPRIVHKVINLQMNQQFGYQDSITLNRQSYTPWHDSQDADEVLFASVHGYHKHNNEQFYPGTGATTKGILQALIDMNSDPYRIIAQNIELTEEERLQFFSATISSRTAAVDLLRKCIDKREEMTKTGEGVKQYVSPVLLDIFDGDEDKAFDFVKNNRSLESQSQKVQRGLHQMLQGMSQLQQQQQQHNDIFGQQTTFDDELINLPPSIYPGDLPTDLPLHLALDERKNRILNAGLGKQTKEQWRQVWQHTIIPGIVAHRPDLIMISAGFDAHHRDKINSGHVGVDEDDFYWITRQLMKVANLCCEGRIVSCLEGGYRIHCGFASPFARSVAAHVRALHEGGNEPWTPEDVHVEVQIAHDRDQWKQALDRFTERERENMKLQQEMQYRREAMAVANNNNNTTTTMGDDDSNNNNNNGFNPTQTTIDPMTGEYIVTTTQPPNELDTIDTSNIIASSGGRSSRQRSPVDYNALSKAFDKAKKQKANPNVPKSTETTTNETATTETTTNDDITTSQ